MPNNEVLLDEPALWLPSNLDAAGDPLPGEPQYTPRVDRRLIEALITDGVFDRLGGHMLVRQRAAGANMSVEVDPGFAGVMADGQAYAGRYLAVANAVQTLQIDDAPASGARIDLIVARVHDSSITGIRNAAVYETVKGVTDAGGNPVVPALPDSSLPLAEILVTATVAGQPRVSVTGADITDLRVQARVPLGVTQFLVQGVQPTETLRPDDWPEGITTTLVTTAFGWPTNGMLTTIKHSISGTKQELVETSGGFRRFFRAARNEVTGWEWFAWAGVPLAPKTIQDTGTITRTSSAWGGSPTGLGVTGIYPGINGGITVSVSARFNNVAASGIALMGFQIELGLNNVVVAPTEFKAAGLWAVAGYLYCGRIVEATGLDPNQFYIVRAQFKSDGTNESRFFGATISAQGF